MRQDYLFPPRLLPARRLSFVFLMIVLLLTGCDAVDTGSGSLVLQPKEAVFRFSFSTDVVQTGQPSDIPSDNTVDLTSALSADGFTKAEVLGARLTSARLERINPLGVEISFLDDANVLLTAAGLSSTSVATQTTFPAGRSVNLNVVSGTSLSAPITRPSFSAILRITPNTLLANEDYILEVKLSIEIEVEGV